MGVIPGKISRILSVGATLNIAVPQASTCSDLITLACVSLNGQYIMRWRGHKLTATTSGVGSAIGAARPRVARTKRLDSTVAKRILKNLFKMGSELDL